MTYRALADSVAIFHAIWAIGMLLMIPVGLKYGRFFPCTAIMAVTTTAAQLLFGFRCPLTILENALRLRAAGSSVHIDSFVTHYAEKLIGISVPEVSIVIVLVAILGFWALVHIPMFRHANKSP